MNRYQTIKQKAQNHWPAILRELGGLRADQLKNEHQPCPLCGGKDRYRFDNVQGSGSWYCSHCGGRDEQGGAGDGFSLLMRLRKWSVQETTEEVARWLGETPRMVKKSTPQEEPTDSGYELICPILGDLPLPTQPRHFKLGSPEALWVYRNAENCPLMIVARFCDKSTGKKDVLPYTLWKKGEHVTQWRWKALPSPRPLYGLDVLASKTDARVLIVEGEKTADAARRLLPTWAVVTWPGGCKAIHKVDWSPLYGRDVVIWPDADKQGEQAADAIYNILRGKTSSLFLVRPPLTVTQGWDLADAEARMWTQERIEAWIQDNAYTETITQANTTKTKGQNDSHPSTLPVWLKRPQENQIVEALVQTYKDQLAYDPLTNQWYAWHESVWEKIPEIAAKKMIREAFDVAFAYLGYSYKLLNSCTQLLSLELTAPAWSGSPNLLPLKNGVLNLETHTLKPHSPQDYFNWQLPYAYDEQAECPLTQAWMRELSQGDGGMTKILQAWLNVVVKGRTTLHRYLELIGPAGTGKSTFLKLAMALVGSSNTVTTDLKHLEQNRFESASLYGKRLCLVTDSSRYGGSVDVLKALTGGDPLRYEEKYCVKGNSFVPQCLVMIAANEPIQSTDYTNGLQRRRLTLHFDHRIPHEKRDPLLEAKLNRELPGILNWALQLSDSEVEAILLQPEAYSAKVALSTRSNMTETNPLAAWLDECILYNPFQLTKIGTRDHDGGTTNKNYQLYPNYVYFCQTTGHSPLAQRRFSHVLLDLCESLGYEVKRFRRAEGWMFKGLAIKQSVYNPTPSMVTGYSFNADEEA